MVYGPATLSESPEHNKGEYFQGPSQLKKEKSTWNNNKNSIFCSSDYFSPIQWKSTHVMQTYWKNQDTVVPVPSSLQANSSLTSSGCSPASEFRSQTPAFSYMWGRSTSFTARWRHLPKRAYIGKASLADLTKLPGGEAIILIFELQLSLPWVHQSSCKKESKGR